MKHHKPISREPSAAQTTLQVKLDFLVDVSSVGINIANQIITTGTTLVSSLSGLAGNASSVWLTKGLGSAD